ncbi:MAG: hypothetical protein Q4C47_06625 [Planctomycetia bacterium]|nr:hypothetical protein [Planctomycetia bacterium]
MTATNRWTIESNAGKVRKNLLVRVKAVLTSKASSSTATAAEDDYYDIDCTAKGLPSLTDPSVWSVVTDNPEHPVGFRYVGKSEGFETIELTTETAFTIVYGLLQAHLVAGDVFTLVFTYDDPLETSVHTLSVPACTLCGLASTGGETTAGSTTTIRFQPMGGTMDNMPTLTSTART